MSDRRWEATADAAARIERAAERYNIDQLRGDLESIVARFHDCRGDDAPARVALALARACLAVLDAEDDDEEEWDD